MDPQSRPWPPMPIFRDAGLRVLVLAIFLGAPAARAATLLPPVRGEDQIMVRPIVSGGLFIRIRVSNCAVLYRVYFFCQGKRKTFFNYLGLTAPLMKQAQSFGAAQEAYRQIPQ